MSNRRPTKAERKEAARREREQLQRRMATQRRNRRIAVVVSLAVAVAAVVYFATRPGPDIPTPEELLADAASAATAAGCGEVETVAPYGPDEQDQQHVGPGASIDELPPLVSYPSTPPVSGPHADRTAPAGTYDSAPSLGQVLHSLEHAAVVVWYDPNAPTEEIDRIRTFFRDPENRAHVIVGPYDYPDAGPAGRLPGGAQMAIAAWHHVQYCDRPSLEAAFDFVAEYRFPPFGDWAYLGDAPEPGAAI